MWRLDRNLASATVGDLNFEVSLDTGHHGVRLQAQDKRELATLWSLPDFSEQPIVDSYVRDNDLICLLAPTHAFPFHAQLYWTVGPLNIQSSAAASFSLLVALRTDLLDSQPSIAVTTKTQHNSMHDLHVSSGPAYVGLLGNGLAMIDFAIPEDCELQQLVATSGGANKIERRLFGHFLEKGVIRCGRLFAAFRAGLPDGTNWPDTNIEQVCDEFLATELPLTT